MRQCVNGETMALRAFRSGPPDHDAVSICVAREGHGCAAVPIICGGQGIATSESRSTSCFWSRHALEGTGSSNLLLCGYHGK